MKSVLVVLCLHLGRILWCHRGVRVGRARRVRLVGDLQKLLEVASRGVIDFNNVELVVRDRIVSGFSVKMNR